MAINLIYSSPTTANMSYESSSVGSTVTSQHEGPWFESVWGLHVLAVLTWVFLFLPQSKDMQDR